MELHPLCTLFPRMAGHDFECLKLDIKENGLRTPITIHKNMILDGGNRYKACIELGINPIYETFVGEELGAFVLTSNLHRRHLTPGQQAAIVACVQDWAKAHTQGRPTKRCNVAPLTNAEDRAAQSGASIRTQKSADKLAKAKPELAAQVARGEISLPKAEKQAFPKPKLDPELDECDERDMMIDALNSTVEHLTKENERMKNALAVGIVSDDDKGEIASRLETLTEENRKLVILNKGLIASRDSHMTENASLKKQCAAYQRKIKALEK